MGCFLRRNDAAAGWIGYSTGKGGMVSEENERDVSDAKRWSARRKARLVLNILKSCTTLAETCCQYDLTPWEVAKSQKTPNGVSKNALRVRAQDLQV